MSIEQSLVGARLIVELLQVLAWPLIALFVLLYFGRALRQFANRLGELSFKAAGLEATAKVQQIEAAAFLGVAAASKGSAGNGPQPTGDDAKEIAAVVARSATPRIVSRLSNAQVLWVDDKPENNVYERRALETFGIQFTLSTSTEDALERARLSRYDAIISDMGRPPDPRAGYTLLDALRMQNDRTPFVIYAGSNSPEHKAEARRHGALGSTNRGEELLQLVLTAITEGQS